MEADHIDKYPFTNSKIGDIYLARNMINGDIYIGKAHNGIRSRKSDHIRTAKNGNGEYFHRAMRKYGVCNFRWSVIKRGPIEELSRLEISAIAQYKRAGYKVYNLTDGGEGCLNLSPELLAKRNAAIKKAWADLEVRTRQSDTLKAALNCPEVRKKYSAASKISQNRPEVKAKIKATRSTPEAKARYSAIQKEAQNRPEVSAKRTSAIREVCSRPEVRAKSSAARRAVWANRKAVAKAEGEAAMERILAIAETEGRVKRLLDKDAPIVEVKV
jgi:group I intron endonuclease